MPVVSHAVLAPVSRSLFSIATKLPNERIDLLILTFPQHFGEKNKRIVIKTLKAYKNMNTKLDYVHPPCMNPEPLSVNAK